MNRKNKGPQENLDMTFKDEEQLKAALELFPMSGIDPSSLTQFNDEVVEGLYAFGYGYYDKGRYSEAESIFRILTAVRIRSSKFWKGLGAALQMLKKYDQAVEAYSWAAVHDDLFSDPYPHFHAAECLYSLGKIKRGLKALFSAKKIAEKKGSYEGLLSQIALLRNAWRKKIDSENE